MGVIVSDWKEQEGDQRAALRNKVMNELREVTKV